jgi:hypothetical protein
VVVQDRPGVLRDVDTGYYTQLIILSWHLVAESNL